MTATMTNGKPRKQLSDQIERLDEQLQRHDAILDALSEGLNGAVADAAREGTKEAVTAAVIELLTNGDLRAALHKASAPEGNPQLSRWERLKARARQAATKVKAIGNSVVTTVAARVAKLATAARNLCRPIHQSVQARVAVQVLVAATAVAVGVRYYAARQFTLAVSWVKSAAHSLHAKVNVWARVILPVPAA